MPLYEYECKQCGHRFEKIQSFSAPIEQQCPVCPGELERLISGPAFQFKGAGWYVTDYAAKKPSGDGEKADKAGAEAKETAGKEKDGSSKEKDSSSKEKDTAKKETPSKESKEKKPAGKK